MVKYFSFFSISISSSVFFPFFLCFSRWSVPIKWLTKNLQFFYLFISPLTSSIFLFSLFPLFLTSFEKYFCKSWNSYLFVLLCSSTFPSSFPIAKKIKSVQRNLSPSYYPCWCTCVFIYLFFLLFLSLFLSFEQAINPRKTSDCRKACSLRVCTWHKGLRSTLIRWCVADITAT